MLSLPVRRVAFVLATLGFAMSAVAFFPGSAPADFLWLGVAPTRMGVTALFFVHLLAFWAGLFLVAKAMIDAGTSWGALAPLAGAFPMLFDFFRVVDGETALACAWLLASALAFERFVAGRAVIVSALGASAILIYGALLRLAALPAAAPLLVWLAGKVAPQPRWARWAALGAAAAIVVGLAFAIDGAAFDARRQRALIAYDLGNMSSRIGENLLPGRWTRADEAQILQCGPSQWRGDGRCAFVAEALPREGLWGAWAGTSLGHPGAYARHRLDHANRLLRWLGEAPELVTDEAANVSSLRADGNPVLGALAPVANMLGPTPLFRGYAWLLGALAVTWLAFLATDSPARRFSVAVGASALIYFAVQIFCGVDDSFHRLFWPVTATLAGGAALLACRWPPHSKFGALVLIGCVCVAAFAASALI